MKKIVFYLLLLFLLIINAASVSRASTDTNAVDRVKQPARDLFNFLYGIGDYIAPPEETVIPDETQPSGQPTSVPSGTAPTFGPPPAPVYTADVANLMERVKDTVHGSCTSAGRGIITSSNSDCVDPVADVEGVKNGQNAVSQLKYSADSFEYVQCVGCAVAMAQANGIPYGGWGNAKQHANQFVMGYDYVPYDGAASTYKIKPGSLFVLTSGTYGHIGMVTEIIKDETGRPHSFRALECNYQRSGYFSHEKIWSFDQIAGFQVPES